MMMTTMTLIGVCSTTALANNLRGILRNLEGIRMVSLRGILLNQEAARMVLIGLQIKCPLLARTASLLTPALREVFRHEADLQDLLPA